MPKNPEQEFDDLVNEGEGNKTAAREYNEKATEHAGSGKSEPAAKEAEAAIEGPEGDELRRAEKVGKERMAEEDPELRK